MCCVDSQLSAECSRSTVDCQQVQSLFSFHHLGGKTIHNMTRSSPGANKSHLIRRVHIVEDATLAMDSPVQNCFMASEKVQHLSSLN